MSRWPIPKCDYEHAPEPTPTAEWVRRVTVGGRDVAHFYACHDCWRTMHRLHAGWQEIEP